MDRRLIEAAKKGDVEKLHHLIRDDPLLVSTAALTEGDTPLHIACIAGHLQFVKEMLILDLDFAGELNQDGLSPLHIASARGDLEIAKEFFKVGTHLCLVKGKDRRIPLHSAVVKGRIHVIAQLLQACPDSIQHLTARGESCLHLAVRNNQYQALQLLCQHVVSFNKEGLLNCKDDRGNTILHLAASRKQYEIFDLLLEGNSVFKEKLDVNALNKRGLTPLDILTSEGGDSEIEEMLTLAGASTQIEPHADTGQDQEQSNEHDNNHRRSASKRLQDYLKYDRSRESPGKARNTLLVITVLIATATYQAVLSPPGGVWQDDRWPDPAINNTSNSNSNSSSNSKEPPAHTAGESVMGTHNRVAYGLFLLFNSMGFFMSLHMMNFLTCGLPMQFELRVALFALTATYDACMVAIAPSSIISTFFIVLSILMPLIMVVLTKVVRDFKKGCRPCVPRLTASV